MDTPIYDELAAKFGVSIPDPIDANPLSTLLPVTEAATPTMAIPVVRPAVDDTTVLPAVRPSRAPVEVGGPEGEVLERIDGWCEDRPQDLLEAT